MKDDSLYVQHILDCIAKIQKYTAAGREPFFESTLIQDAVVRNLQVLAESAKRIDGHWRDLYPSVPWRQIAGFRNIAVHEYLGIDLNDIWDIVSLDLPSLRKEIEKLQAEMS